LDKIIEDVAGRIHQALRDAESSPEDSALPSQTRSAGAPARSQDSYEVMQLKLKLEISASKLFLTLGWMLREGKIALEPSEHGYRVRLAGIPEEEAIERGSV